MENAKEILEVKKWELLNSVSNMILEASESKQDEYRAIVYAIECIKTREEILDNPEEWMKWCDERMLELNNRNVLNICKKGVKIMVVVIKSEAIRKILARKNMSQNWFAKQLDVSSSYMSQLMTGVRNPSPDLRIKILEKLKMDESGFDKVFEIKD